MNLLPFVAANNIYASEEEEHSERLKHLTQAYAWCAVLIYDLNKLCEAVLGSGFLRSRVPFWLSRKRVSSICIVPLSVGAIERDQDVPTDLFALDLRRENIVAGMFCRSIDDIAKI